MERAYFSTKFKDDIKGINTVDILSFILKIVEENAMKPTFNPKFAVFLNTFYFWIGILKQVFLIRRWHFSYANQSQKEKQSGSNLDAFLNDFTDLESESIKIMLDTIFLWIVPMMQF